MENCVAPGLDKMWYIIRSSIVFRQSTCRPVNLSTCKPRYYVALKLDRGGGLSLLGKGPQYYS